MHVAQSRESEMYETFERNVYPITHNIIDTHSDTQKGQTTCMHYMCKWAIAYWGERELGVWLNWPCIVDIVSRGLPVCCH